MPASTPLPPPAGAAAARAGGAMPVVLFVDDEPAVLAALRRLARRLDCRVLTAAGAEEGLSQLDAHAVDVIVADLRMPGMDGASFLARAREREPAARRLLLASGADLGAIPAAITQGRIHRYVDKPWDDAELLDALEDAFARHRLERENARLLDLAREQDRDLTEANARLAGLNASLEQRVRSRTAELEQINGQLQASCSDLDRNFLVGLDVFVGLLELREAGVAGFSRRVARRAEAVAVELRLAAPMVRDVRVAGLLHAIGRLALPEPPLHKPQAERADDARAQPCHLPLAAARALLPLPALQQAAAFVRAQHERVDGQGAPDGLRGDEVPLGARIIAACAEYERRVDGHGGGRPLDAEAAAARIADGAGRGHWGDDVAAALLATRAAVDAANAPPLPEADDAVLVAPEALRPGMVFARALYSDRGALLLAAGMSLDDRGIRAIRDLSARRLLPTRLPVRPAAGARG